ncbi:MAG: GNAT family N-acetyltransferase [Chloroflexi bacterium]|nr:GNAT family N-acetyltransferase [Chloroflexota bacterium]
MDRVNRVLLRPYELADDEGLARLRSRAYPAWPEAHDDAWHRSIHRWLADAPHAAQMFRWVAATGDRVVGHLAAVPIPYLIDGRSVEAHTPTDFMSWPGYGFHALALMRRFFRTTTDYVACDSVPEAMAIEKSFGVTEVGDLRSEMKLVDPSSYPFRPRGVPQTALVIASIGTRAVDRVLMGAHRGLPVDRLTGFDERFDELLQGVSEGIRCTVRKDASFLSWRYGAGSPQHSPTILAVISGRSLLGYAIMRSTKDRDAYLLDLTASPGRADVARALLHGVVDQARQAGAAFLRYRFVASPTAPSARDLARLGFLNRDGSRYTLPGLRTARRHTLLVRFADEDTHSTASDIDHWSYSIGDGEVSFWVK